MIFSTKPRRPHVAFDSRFWAKVDRDAEQWTCWLWTGAKSDSGQGQISKGTTARFNQLRIASRAAWELTRGPIPFGLQVLHRCDEPSCVNPTHLFLGTQLDNIQDMLRKNRGRWAK